MADGPPPRALLFVDGDLAGTAANTAPLTVPVLAGEADMTIALLPAQSAPGGGRGLVVNLSRKGILRATGWTATQPLSGMRCLTREAFEAARPLARGWGVETAMTIDLLTAGFRVAEVPCDLQHRVSGTDLAAQLHRGSQYRDVALALAVRRARGVRDRLGRVCQRRPEEAGLSAASRGRGAAACLAASGTALLGVAVAGESAAVPGLGSAAWHPPWSFDTGPDSGTVALVLAVGYVLGAAGVLLGLWAVAGGARLSRRAGLVATLAVCAAVLCVPPVGSGDHLNYAAYGRIAAAGDDPYVERPTSWRDGTDPVASASQPPWAGTRSVYGPVATAAQAMSSLVGGDSLRLTVWVWQLVVVCAFAACGWMLTRLAARAAAPWSRCSGRTRPPPERACCVLWTLNPFVVGTAVLGAHVDVLAVAFALAAVSLTRHAPLLAGAAVGAAAAVKLPYVLVAWRCAGRSGTWAGRDSCTPALGVVGALAVGCRRTGGQVTTSTTSSSGRGRSCRWRPRGAPWSTGSRPTCRRSRCVPR